MNDARRLEGSTYQRAQPRVRFVCIALVLGAGGCAEEGRVPDCPPETDYLSDGQVLDEAWPDSSEFREWRSDAERAGCVTPLGGWRSSVGGAGGGR